MNREQPYAYVKQYYGVDPVIGSRVATQSSSEKKYGVIVRKRSYDQYVHVKFDGTKFDVPCHPLDLEYGVTAHFGKRPHESDAQSDGRVANPSVGVAAEEKAQPVNDPTLHELYGVWKDHK